LEVLSFPETIVSSCLFTSGFVYDGVDATAPQLASYCGYHWLTVVMSSSNALCVSFRTYFGTHGDFKIKYTAI